MVCKEIAYLDYNGEQRKEKFYFNFNKPELVEMQVSEKGGLDEYLKKIVAEKDVNKLVGYIKKFILDAYGEKSPDGKYFIKSKELSIAFSQTEAFSDLFMEMSSDADKFANFVGGVIPTIVLDQLPDKVKNPDNLIMM